MVLVMLASSDCIASDLLADSDSDSLPLAVSLSGNIHFFFATRFTVFATFFKFSPHPPIFSSVLYSEPTQAIRLKSRPPPARPPPPHPIHPAHPARPPPSRLAAWTTSGAALPPACASSTSTPCQRCRLPPADR